MAFDSNNVVQAALNAMQEHFVTHDRWAIDYPALRFIFMEGEGVIKEADLQAIADYLEALPWVERVHIVWDRPKLIVLPALP